jgi:hypothetical protein
LKPELRALFATDISHLQGDFCCRRNCSSNAKDFVGLTRRVYPECRKEKGFVAFGGLL